MAMSLIRPQTVLFDNGTVLRTSAAFLSIIVFARITAAGKVSSSAMMNGFLDLDTSGDTAYDPSKAFVEIDLACLICFWLALNSASFRWKNSAGLPTQERYLVLRRRCKWDGFMLLLESTSPQRKHNGLGGSVVVEINPERTYCLSNLRCFTFSIFHFLQNGFSRFGSTSITVLLFLDKQDRRQLSIASIETC